MSRRLLSSFGSIENTQFSNKIIAYPSSTCWNPQNHKNTHKMTHFDNPRTIRRILQMTRVRTLRSGPSKMSFAQFLNSRTALTCLAVAGFFSIPLCAFCSPKCLARAALCLSRTCKGAASNKSTSRAYISGFAEGKSSPPCVKNTQ